MDRMVVVVGAVVGAAGLIGLALSSSVASCGSRSVSEVVPATTPSTGTCATRLETPAFEPVPPPASQPRSSQLVVELEVSREALTRAIDEGVPKSLGAATRKPIGTPGELTYRVSRGSPKVSLDDGSLAVELPIHAAVEICKPLGPLCPTYGSCQPDLRATAKVPLMFGPDYELAPAEVDVAVTRGCRIAGLDVTDRVSQAARGAVGTAERRIREAVPPIPPLADKVRQRLGQPVRLDPTTCLKLVPSRVQQWVPHETAPLFGAAVAVEGRVELVACDATFDPPPLPPVERAEGKPPASEVQVRQLVTYDDLSRRIAEAVVPNEEAAPPTIVLTALRASPHRTAEGPRLALELALEGSVCGRTWVLARPEIVGGQLRLTDLEPISSGDAPALAPILARLGGAMALSAPELELAALAERLADAIPLEGTTAALEGAAERREVVPTAGHLALVTRTTGRLVVRIRTETTE